MRKQYFKLFLLLIIASGLSSCGKYEEGPSFSLRTKTARLTGSWVIDKVITNGVPEELPQDSFDLKFTFERGGTGRITIGVMGFSFSADLEWEFTSDKENFRMRIKDFSTGVWSDWEESEILKLTNKEFWLRNEGVVEMETYITVTQFIKT